ncbi:hypothetical protein Tco_1156100 [Tanacetum coccineum]
MIKKCSNPTSAISDERIANPNTQIGGDDMVRIQVPRCMAWLDYDEHVDSLSTMDNKVGVTSPESTTQTLPLFEEYTLPVTYPKEVEKTLGTNRVPSFDGPEPQPLLNSPSLDVSLGDVIGPEPPIKSHSPDSSKIKVVDYLTTQTPPSPHMANSHPKGVYSYYNPSIDDPKRHYRFKPGLLGKSVPLGVDISNWEMFDDDWGSESKEVSPLGEGLSLFDRPNKVERGRILEAHRLESILQQQISQCMAPSHHDGRKDYLLEDNIWKAFGGNTHDLGSFGEETDKTTDLHQHILRISTQKLETASQITRDAVITHLKTASQDLQTASESDFLSKLVVRVLPSLVPEGDPYSSTSCEVFEIVGSCEDECVGVGAESTVDVDAFGV